jgi:hypothetical protein
MEGLHYRGAQHEDQVIVGVYETPAKVYDRCDEYDFLSPQPTFAAG